MRKGKKAIIAFAVILILIIAAGAAGFFISGHYLNKINRVDEEVETVPAEMEDFETDANPGVDVLDPADVIWPSDDADTPDAADPATSAVAADPASESAPDSASAQTPGSNGSSSGDPSDDKSKANNNNAASPKDNDTRQKDDHMLNILLVGQDRRPGEGRMRSDAMILCSINPDTKKLSMISFLRDMYVQIPGYSDNKLNATYVFGGFPLLKSALKKNFGVTVDGCFEVDFDGFRTLIDQIGGVDINLTAEEAELVGRGTQEGMNNLNGHAALTYARIRKIGTDFARTNRQRTVLLAAYNKIKNQSPTELLKLLDTALPYVTTDMSNSEIYATAVKLLPMVTSLEINTYYVPTDGMYTPMFIREMYVLLPDLPAIRNVLRYEYMPY